MIPYILYLTLVVFLTNRGSGNRYARIIVFILASLFIGLRENVGKDYEGYKYYYETEYYFFEPGYSFICQFFNSYGLSVTYVFFVMAFLTYGFIYLFLEKIEDKKHIYTPAAIMLYFVTISITCNVVRECLVASIILYSYHCIKDSNIIKFLLLVAFASLFHYSALICLPLYWIKLIRFPIKYYIAIYVFSFVFCFLSLEQMVSAFLPYFENYKRWAGYLDSDKYASNYFSLGLLLELSIYILTLYISLKSRIHEKDNVLFNLFFIACVAFNMRIGSPLMTRIGMLFNWYLYLIVPVSLNMSIRNNKKFIANYFILYFTLTFVHYVMFDKNSIMYPYNDVLGIF